MTYDIVIKDGTIIDGSGGTPYRSDLAIKNGKIVAFGRIRESANETIDADGLAVSPGIIDAHTHFDAQVAWDPLGTSSCWHGVTSVVMGNCGFTLAPCRPGDSENLIRALEAVEAIPAEAMIKGIDWRWTSYRQYLENLDRLPKGINFGGYVGHSALRPYIMGERAFSEQATGEEIEAMRAELRDALEAGALGFSTSRGPQHVTPDGNHVPSYIAGENEVDALIGVLDDLNTGIFELARPRTDEGFQWFRDLAHRVRVPLTYGCIPTQPDWRKWLDLADEAAAVGGRVVLQAHSRMISSVWGFQNQLPWDFHPVWNELRKRPLPEQAAALRDPQLRARLVKAAYEEPEGNALMGTAARIKDADEYEWITVFRSPSGPNPSIAQVARERGKDPVDVVIELSLERDLKQFFMQPLYRPDDNVTWEILSHPRSVATFSDSGAHVTQICDTSLQTHMLSHWVREKQAISLEQAIRKMTYDIATHWELHDRGLLREGLAADVMVFDPATIAPDVPQVSYDLPGGAMRLTQRAVGIHCTIVNGQVLLRDGQHTGAYPGTVLRGSLSRRLVGVPG